MALSMRMNASWDVAPCSLVGVYQLLKVAYCIHHQGDNDGSDVGGSKHL
jgi:hypothetical protein